MKEATTPSTGEPSGWAATKLMKASGSLTAGGGATRPRRLVRAEVPPVSATPGAASTSSVAVSIAARSGSGSLRLRPRDAFLAALAARGAALSFLGFAAFLGSAARAFLTERASARLPVSAFVAAARFVGAASFCFFLPAPLAAATAFSAFFLAGLATGSFASALVREPGGFAARFSAFATSAALRGAESPSSSPSASLRVDLRLFGPRTGRRGVKIQPTPGTGLPPTRRPSSNSHGCSS